MDMSLSRLQEIMKDREAWHAAVLGATKSGTWLSDWKTTKMVIIRIIRSVQSIGPVRLFVTPWTATCQASLSFIISWSLLKLMSIELVMPSNHVILCCPFLSCPQSFPASESLLMSWLLASGGQGIGASVLASVLPNNIQDWFPLELTGLIFLQSKGLSTVFSNTTVQKHQFSGTQSSLWSSSHIHTWLLEKVISLLFNTLSRFVIAFLPRSKCLLISWLHLQWFWSPRK